MASLGKRQRRVSTTLHREATDWGLSVSEKKPRKGLLNVVILLASSIVLTAGLFVALPIVLGALMSAEITLLGLQLGIIFGLAVIAIFLGVQSRKGPKNAFELDEMASQLRIGFLNRYGAFVRRRVIPLKNVRHASVTTNKDGKPELKISLAGESFNLALIDAKEVRLDEIAERITRAAEQARQNPRSRIESSIAGIGASYRELSRRVVSRVAG